MGLGWAVMCVIHAVMMVMKLGGTAYTAIDFNLQRRRPAFIRQIRDYRSSRNKRDSHRCLSLSVFA